MQNVTDWSVPQSVSSNYGRFRTPLVPQSKSSVPEYTIRYDTCLGGTRQQYQDHNYDGRRDVASHSKPLATESFLVPRGFYRIVWRRFKTENLQHR